MSQSLENTTLATERRDDLARQVIDLAKASILAQNHFLAVAIGRLEVKPFQIDTQFGTDGLFLACETNRILRNFLTSKEPPIHDLLHTIVHCLFVHPYVNPSVERRLWDLASDIATERVVMELLGPRPGARGSDVALAVEQVERDMQSRADAERIYRHLREGRWSDCVASWESLMKSDSHILWYAPAGSSDDEQGSGTGEGTDPLGGIGRMDGTSQSTSYDRPNEADNGEDNEGDEQNTERNPNHGRANASGASPFQEGNERPSETDEGASAGAQPRPPQSQPRSGQSARQQQRDEWRAIAASLSVQLQTLSSRIGGQLPGFVDDLIAVNQDRVNYAEFLRQFAVPGEVLHLSDDEFDQVFYTYGLQLYGNLPLIEPLEYREERRVREFVIVVDTSGSVRGDAVRAFVNTTFDILKSAEAFFDNVNVRVLQCDVEVTDDKTITNTRDLALWSAGFHARGGGGTDFRPAFAYVDQLLERGELRELGGLVYFTDGWGVYPERTPSYRTVFAFYDEDHRPEIVPPWALQVTLDDDILATAAQQAS